MDASSKISGFTFAVLAGRSCAALASVFGKLAMDASVIRASSFLSSIAALLTLTPETMALVLRVLCFGMIFLMNALSIFFSTIHSLNLLKVWNFFVKSMNLSTSLNATVINSSLNYFFTAVFGYILFGESLPIQWWIGAAVILFGVFLISKGQKSKTQ